MKVSIKYLLVVSILFFVSPLTYSQYDSIPHDGLYRTYLVNLPLGYSGEEELPLLIAMHGGFGNAYNMQNMSQLSQKADEENFIVVYPEGVEGGALNAAAWNAGWCCGYASNTNIDDVGFISNLIDTLSKNLAVDLNRVYATGMSNGGFMSYRLACELSDKIAAIAPVSASMSMTNCNPTRPVPVISFHSYLDTNVPHDGGQGDGASNHHNSPQDSVMNAWGDYNSCQNKRDTIISDSKYKQIQWSDCDCKSEVNLYITEDGGHSWHGGPSLPFGDDPSEYISANDLMWEFFQKYSLDCGILSVDEIKANQVKIFPNPTNKAVNIEVNSASEHLEIRIFSPTGALLREENNQTYINIEDLPSGILLFEIKVDDERFIHKVVKE